MESLYECTHSLKSVIQFKYMHMFPLGLSGKGERERKSHRGNTNSAFRELYRSQTVNTILKPCGVWTIKTKMAESFLA